MVALHLLQIAVAAVDLIFEDELAVPSQTFAQAADVVDAVLLRLKLADAVVDLIFVVELAALSQRFAQAADVVDATLT